MTPIESRSPANGSTQKRLSAAPSSAPSPAALAGEDAAPPTASPASHDKLFTATPRADRPIESNQRANGLARRCADREPRELTGDRGPTQLVAVPWRMVGRVAFSSP